MKNLKIRKAKPVDYDEFSLSSFNRPLRSITQLLESMRRYGFLPTHPIVVERNGDDEFLIREGHHRFAAARSLGIPFYYIIDEKGYDVAQIESTPRTWSPRDYAHAYAQRGLRDYQELLYYHENTKIALSTCVFLLGEDNPYKKLKMGEFKISPRKRRLAIDVFGIAKTLQEINKRIGRHSGCVQAIASLVHLHQFEPRRMIHKIRTHPGKLMPMPDQAGYMSMLEELYNYRSQDKVDLVFLAQRAADERRNRGKRKR